MLTTTNRNIKWWQQRKINWKKDYFDTWNHPHRKLIIEKLKHIKFGSILEYGCGSGPNLKLIHDYFPRAQLGGIDISEDAINLAKRQMPYIINLEVGDGREIFWSDKSSDVVLTDMALIYISPFKIKKMLAEIKRIARNNIILVEFHSKSILKRAFLALAGYWSYDYEKLLIELGFWDVQIEKIKEKDWPGGEPQKTYGFIISARI